MSPVLLLVAVAASDAVADLWRVLRRGPASGTRLLGRLFGSALLRGGGLVVWVSITSAVASWRAPMPIEWSGLWPALVPALLPLVFSGIAVAPHIGQAIYLGLHTLTVLQLTTRLQVLAGLSMLDSAFAVLLGAAGFWLSRGIGMRRRGPLPRLRVQAGGLP